MQQYNFLEMTATAANLLKKWETKSITKQDITEWLKFLNYDLKEEQVNMLIDFASEF